MRDMEQDKVRENHQSDPINSRNSDLIWSDPSNSSKTCAIWSEQNPRWVLGLLILLFLYGCCVWLLKKKSFWKWVVFECLRRRLFNCLIVSLCCFRFCCEYWNWVWTARFQFDGKWVWWTQVWYSKIEFITLKMLVS